MKCPKCSEEIEDIPEDTEIVVCPNCHTPVEVNQPTELSE